MALKTKHCSKSMKHSYICNVLVSVTMYDNVIGTILSLNPQGDCQCHMNLTLLTT